GYPIDRLRINPPQPTSALMEPQTLSETIVQQDKSDSDAKDNINSENPAFKRIGKDKPNPSIVPSFSSYEKPNCTSDSMLADTDYDLITPSTIEDTVLLVLQPYNNTRIGFHYNCSLFFNVRYFEHTFAEKLDLQGNNAANKISNMHIINFYFMKSCHLLVHNVHVNHDTKFIRTFEDTVIKFLPAKDAFLELFKFS
ncbi:unnamed protein product, partial [Rotaria sordida]